MPISGTGSSCILTARQRALCRFCRLSRQRRQRRQRGFTLVELLIVLAIVALAVGLVTLSLPDGDEGRLEEEGARLSALLDMARAEARVVGVPVRWLPRTADQAAPAAGAPDFQFVGLPTTTAMPTRWLDPRTTASIQGSTSLVLGPEAILPAQRLVLRLGDKRLELVSDGLGPFAPPRLSAGAPP